MICCLIFIAFLGGMAFGAVHGLAKGNPKLLALGWDNAGNGCGFSEATLDYPYLYWPKKPYEDIELIIADNALEAVRLLNEGVCVKECPATPEDPVDCYNIEMTSSFRWKDCVNYPDAR